MNSIARALNNIALSLNSIAVAITNSKKVDLVNTAHTSNPISSVTITKTSGFSNDKQPPKVSITYEEKTAIDAIYDALVIKGSHPHHHDNVMQDLSANWPVLYKALAKFMRVRESAYNPSYSSKENIWNYKDARKWNR